MDGILTRLLKPAEWEVFYQHKCEQGNMSRSELQMLRDFVDRQVYVPMVESIISGESFPLPEKILINKARAGKKRTVYSFGDAENILLKHMAYCLRDYDHIFSPNLYSFRKNSGVKRAVNNVLNISGLDSCYVYKVDISDYFNSVNIELLLPELKAVLCNDPGLYGFIENLLEQPYVIDNGAVVCEKKGIMAGVPISGFLANLYLRDLDRYFYERRIPYMRYSDDIIVFAKSKQLLLSYAGAIRSVLSERCLTVNSEKEVLTQPGEQWEFLGFSYARGVIDIAPVSSDKLKSKMRRKARALSRWAKRKNASGERAAKAFINYFNKKLYDNPVHNELTWARWFFPIINTDSTLRMIDAYMQDCIRFLATGKRTGAKYNFRYSDIKQLGYRSLVNEYYRFRKCETEPESDDNNSKGTNSLGEMKND